MLGNLIQLSLNTKPKRDFILKNAPEEFIDPITTCLMKDPVRLPSSSKILDRLTIKKHLIYDHTDPFNREPL